MADKSAATTQASVSPSVPVRREAAESKRKGAFRWVWFLVAVAVFFIVGFGISLEGLSPEGQRAFAVLAGILVLWITEVLPLGVVVLMIICALLATQPDIPESQLLSGFASPAVFFLLGVTGLGAGVAESGLANRIAHFLVRAVDNDPRRLYWRSVIAFPLLPLILPSAISRNAIFLPVYRGIFQRSDGALHSGGQAAATDTSLSGHGLPRAITLLLGMLNPLASSMTLTGGSVAITAGVLIGGVSWGEWFVRMAPPYLCLILVGAFVIFRLSGLHRARKSPAPDSETALSRQGDPGPMSAAEKRVALAVTGALLLWLTDWWHGWPPALPAIAALVVIMLPGPGGMAWGTLQRRLSWVMLLTMGAILSLVGTLQATGAVDWFAHRLLQTLSGWPLPPVGVYVLIVLVTVATHLAIPGFVANISLMIPLVMALAPSLGVHPLAAALVVTISTDSVVLYPVQTTTSLMAYEEGHYTAREVLVLGTVMLVAVIAFFSLWVLRYWAWLGLPEG